MSEILLQLHSLLPYLFIILALVALVMAAMAMSSNTFSKNVLSISRVVMILAHLQFLIGVLLLFFGDRAKGAFSGGMGLIMKDSDLRLSFIEHPSMMLIGIILITVGFSRSKRGDSGKAKAKSILIFYSLGLLLILSRIPYSLWFNS